MSARYRFKFHTFRVCVEISSFQKLFRRILWNPNLSKFFLFRLRVEVAVSKWNYKIWIFLEFWSTQSQNSWLDSRFMIFNIPMFSPHIFVLIILNCSSNQGSFFLFELSSMYISFSKWNLLVIPPNNYHRWYQFVSGTWASLTAAAISSAQYSES